MRTLKSGASWVYPEPVAVRVREADLLSPGFFIDRHSELCPERIDVVYVQVDERIRASVACVFGKEETDTAPCDRHEPWKTGLELVLPFLLESEPVIPVDGTHGVLHAQDGNHPFVHVCTISRTEKIAHGLGSAGMSSERSERDCLSGR